MTSTTSSRASVAATPPWTYEFTAFEKERLARIDIMINGKVVDALALIVHRDFAEQRGRKLILKLKKAIPRHQFEIPLQVAIGGKIIARENIRAYRKGRHSQALRRRCHA